MPYLPPIRLTGATILREGELRQRSVAIARGRISKGPLPAVDLQGYLVLPGIVDMLFRPPRRGSAAGWLRACAQAAARHGITTAWVAPGWGWQDDPALDCVPLVGALRPGRAPDLRPALCIESYRTDTTAALVALCRDQRPELAWFASDFARLDDLRQHGTGAGLAAQARRLGLAPEDLARQLEAAALRRREVPRHLCRLAEALDEIGARYGSIGDTGGAMRETHSMIGAGLAACPAAPSAAAAARAMGDPVLLSASDDERLAEFLRGGFGDAIVSDGAPGRLVSLALGLAGPGLADLPRIWSLLSQRPAEIMRLADRGRLDHGCRADLVVVAPDSGAVEATISAGRLVHLSGAARERFAPVLPRGQGELGIAAE